MEKMHVLQTTHDKKHEILHSKLEQTKTLKWQRTKLNTTARFLNST